MRIIISSLLLILALHFLLQGINYRKHIDLCGKKSISKEKVSLVDSDSNLNKMFINKKVPEGNENFKIEHLHDEIDVKQELLNSIQCAEPIVSAANKYIDDKNDANFQSNVLNVNRFYKKNLNEASENDFVKDKPEGENINSFSKISQYSNQPESWNYKNELVMNGGELIQGVTGYDNLTDQYFAYGETSLLSGCSPNKGSCEPPTRGAKVNDDIRMGLGTLNITRRSTS